MLDNTPDTGHHSVDKLLFGGRHVTVALNQTGFGAVNHFHFAQTVGFQRGTGGDRSQMASARPARGATSTEPFSRQDLKRIPF